MYFAHRTARRIKVAITVVAVYVLVVAVLAGFFPASGTSFQEAFLRWFIGIPATLALWFALEWFGTKLLGLPFWLRLPSWVRIALLVTVLVAVVVLVVALYVWWQARSAA